MDFQLDVPPGRKVTVPFMYAAQKICGKYSYFRWVIRGGVSEGCLTLLIRFFNGAHPQRTGVDTRRLDQQLGKQGMTVGCQIR